MDLRIRAISEKHNFKVFIIDITQAMQEITALQQTNPLAAVILSKITAANTLLGLDLKSGEVMSANITTKDGVTGKIIAEFQNNQLRSYIQNPDFEAAKITAAGQNLYQLALGQQGTLTVTRQLRGYEPYVSQVNLLDGGIDSDFMEFATVSNQIKTLIATKAELDENLKLKKVVGFLIGLFPEHTEADINYLDKKIVNSQAICDRILQTAPENYLEIIEDLAADAIVVENAGLEFACTCNYDKTLQAVKMLGKVEIQKMIAEQKPLEVTCDFCKKKYTISVEDLQKLLD